MVKGIIVLEEIPRSCVECPMCYHATDMSIGKFQYERLYRCGLEPEDAEQVYLEDICHKKPDWCPIKPVYADDAHSVNEDKEPVILSRKDMVKFLERTPADDILMVEINDGNDESGVVTDICVGGGTAKGFTYIKVSTDI